MRWLLISLAFLSSILIYGQEIQISKTGNLVLNAGITAQVGTHKQRLGITLSARYEYDQLAFGFRYSGYYAFRSLGPPIKGFESVLSPEINLGSERSNTQYIESSLAPLSFSNYTVSYRYNWYLNTMGTSQRTGSIGIRVRQFELIHENDILAESRSDKFRTAAIGINYHYKYTVFRLSSIMWTGDKDDPNAKRINESSFSRYGYIDLSETKNGRCSHGILSLSATSQIGFGNQISAGIGYDHEKIRNAIQNRFMHDLWFWPSKWNKAKNRHIPMIDTQGNAYIYQEDQKIKQGKPYLDFGINSQPFY